MFPKQHRLDLRRTKSFSRFPHGINSSTFKLYWRFVRGTHPQAAIVISKKVAPTSVQRHRVKRVLRAIITPHFPTLPTDIQMVIVVTKNTVEKHCEKLEEIVEKIANENARETEKT